jgi:diguanylate cyclase (GGDEF)-like protein/PAS domain S-box-containing protein|tara:strand:+ start:1718 stop:4156 length:2439 start_codon:yes stop_codon:yes gene_type:complete
VSATAQSKILIVEDESIVALDIRRRVEKLGYRVTGMAVRAQQAMALIESELPDIVLMDIQLNDAIDGIDVANAINEKYRLPIIFITAYSEDATMGRASQALPYGYLLKPFSERDLQAVLKISLERSKWDQELQRREAHLKLAIDAANMGTWEIGERSGSSVVLANPLKHGDTQFSNWSEFRPLITARDRRRIDREINDLQNRLQDSIELEFEVDDARTGQSFYVLYGVADDQGERGTRDVLGVIQDITARKLAERELQQAALVFNSSSEAIVVTDQNLIVANANATFYQITGLTAVSVQGQPLDLLSAANIGQATREKMNAALAQGECWRGEVRAYRQDDQPFHALVNISRVASKANGPWQYVILISDISEMRRAQAELAYIAYYDTLTGLPNRHLFMDRLNMAIAHAARAESRLAVLFIDLDHFKRVNETLGHQVGDQMLRAIADRLQPVLRTSDTLCRIGGDEFIVIVDAFDTTNDLEALCRKIIKAVHQPMLLGKNEVTPGCSVGISIYPTDTDDKDDLVKMADTAMYSAKGLGRNCYAFYQPQMTRAVAHYLNREQELRHALQQRQFVLYYQPQFSAESQVIVGMEALIRWQHPEVGLLSAAEVIPVAENSSLIVDIGEWVIGEACRQYRIWVDKFGKNIRIAVNVSPRQLREPRFVSIVTNALKTSQMPGEFLELEVTESSLQNCEASLVALRKVESLGVTISIDDFGTGYSCMSSLKLLPIHRLKIDQSFVRDIPAEQNDCAIATAVIALGHQLGLRVIAEGIESREQADFLRAAGCDEMQGYLLSLPLPPADLTELLREHQQLEQ